MRIQTGQRWISESEPELGLGTVLQTSEGRVNLLFPASGQTRLYSAENAPLKRVRFRPGDSVKSCDGIEFVVVEVEEHAGLLTYVGEHNKLPETQLDDSISFHRPEDRLLGGDFDDWPEVLLRRRAVQLVNRMKENPARGFLGGRIDLIPHQLSIAHEVSSRMAPRVLLSDEVGLGKTIEACLIIHRMLLTGSASRVLILVPDSLVNQWFVELLRKFNIQFSIYDEDRCASLDRTGDNPFLDDQCILCSQEFLTQSDLRGQQAIEAGWDLLVVDEAHHLEWSENSVSRDYRLVEALSRHTEGLILLTATPEQLGPESHFARLRLLDPDRYSDYDAFQKESNSYRSVAALVDRILAGETLNSSQILDLEKQFPGIKESPLNVQALLDIYGPGRVIFRNTRARMKGFPRRVVQFHPLDIEPDRDEWIDRLSTEFAMDAGDTELTGSPDLRKDPRILWLVKLLQEISPAKVLLICRTREKVSALEEALRSHIQLKMAVFHEDLTLLQRDRNAAWFSEDEGARILLCSEIGSEGRNFQFAHHLVLFDLPLNPELLEQRIGRLDRIGQKRDIQIHLPYLKGSSQEVLLQWYQNGINAFASNLEGGSELMQRFGQQVHDLALEYPVKPLDEARSELDELIQETSAIHAEHLEKLKSGRDRLLELNSFDADTAESLIHTIQNEDKVTDLEDFLLQVFDHFGVRVEETAPRTYYLNAAGIITDAFPSIPDEGMVTTFDRTHALGREDVTFLSWDHPMVIGSIELLLSKESGNAGFGIWPDASKRCLILESVFILEAVVTGRDSAESYLPPTPVRTVLNHELTDLTHQWNEGNLWKNLQTGNPYSLLDNNEISGKTLPDMVRASHESAERISRQIIKNSLEKVSPLLEGEINRLRQLRRINDHIRIDEIRKAVTRMDNVITAMQGARLRLDSVFLIWQGPSEALK